MSIPTRVEPVQPIFLHQIGLSRLYSIIFQSRVEIYHPDKNLKKNRVELALLDKCFSKIQVEQAQLWFF